MYLLNFSLGNCGLILFSNFETYFSLLKSKKCTLKSLLHLFSFKLYLLQLFSNFQVLSELHSLNLNLCSKQYNKKFVWHLIVVPQLSSGSQHNYSTNTRPAGQANEESMYSLISMGSIHTEVILFVSECPRQPM